MMRIATELFIYSNDHEDVQNVRSRPRTTIVVRWTPLFKNGRCPLDCSKTSLNGRSCSFSDARYKNTVQISVCIKVFFYLYISTILPVDQTLVFNFFLLWTVLFNFFRFDTFSSGLVQYFPVFHSNTSGPPAREIILFFKVIYYDIVIKKSHRYR